MQPQIAIPRQMIWVNAVNNMLHAGGFDPSAVIEFADEILAAYECRFVPPQSSIIPAAPIGG